MLLRIAVGLVALASVSGCGGSDPASEAEAKAVALYDEVMNSAGTHELVPLGVTGGAKAAYHLHFTYAEMADRLGAINDSVEGASGKRVESIGNLVRLMREIARGFLTVAENQIEDIDSAEMRKLRRLTRELWQQMKELRQKR